MYYRSNPGLVCVSHILLHFRLTKSMAVWVICQNLLTEQLYTPFSYFYFQQKFEWIFQVGVVCHMNLLNESQKF